MAMVSDDFSFPKLTTTNNSATQFSISSPCIWRISSLVYPDQGDENMDKNEDEDEDEEDKREVTRKHKSFSEYESGEPEARMDLLWQDFNEREFQRSTSLDCRIKGRPLSGSSDTSVPPDLGMDTCFWRPGLKPNKTSERRGRSLVRRPRRTSTVVLLRALRKLFFVHTLSRDKKSL